MDYFLDKNVLFDFVRLVYFGEEFKWYSSSAIVVLIARDGGFVPHISDATPFSVANYTLYKMERSGIPDAENKVRKMLKFLFFGKWQLTSLSKEEFVESLDEKRFHYEDAYQFFCAKKFCNNIVTRNLKDFEIVKKEIKVFAPVEFLSSKFSNEKPKYFEKLQDMIVSNGR